MTSPNAPDQAKFDQKIHNILRPFVNSDDVSLAVAVSGGGDSMALLLALYHYVQKSALSIKIIALTVDHKLRPDAALEAMQVGEWCQNLGIEHHILAWEFDEMPTSAIQEKARNARYQLMGGFCLSQQVKRLFVAHNLEDNAETFLMRLKRGAGLKGLRGIATHMQRDVGRQQIEIIRPLLSVSRADLRAYLRAHDQAWFDDASNQNEMFERVKIRNFLSENMWLDSAHVAQSAKRLARADDALEFYVEDFWQNKIEFLQFGIAHIKQADFADLPTELKLRLLARLVWTLGGQDSPPRWQKIENLWQQIQGQGRQFCLGRCLVVKKRDGLWFGCEARDGFDAMWAARFQIADLPQRSLYILSLSVVTKFTNELMEKHPLLKSCPKVVLRSMAVAVADDETKMLGVDLKLKIRR